MIDGSPDREAGRAPAGLRARIFNTARTALQSPRARRCCSVRNAMLHGLGLRLGTRDEHADGTERNESEGAWVV